MAARVAGLVASSELTVAAGKLERLSWDGQAFQARIRGRGEVKPHDWRFDLVVNCTGPRGDPETAAGGLLANLRRRRAIRRDPLGLGLDITDDLQVVGADGAPTPGLFAVGPLTRAAVGSPGRAGPAQPDRPGGPRHPVQSRRRRIACRPRQGRRRGGPGERGHCPAAEAAAAARAAAGALSRQVAGEAVRFRLWVIAIDLLLIAFFIAAPFLRDFPAYLFVDYAVAFVLALELGAKALADTSVEDLLPALQRLDRPLRPADAAVPAVAVQPGLPSVLRLWSLAHSEIFWETVGRRYDDTRVEDISKALATLVTFVFVTTGFVYAGFARTHPGIDGYVDALYFTVTTLTTTGLGDITLPGVWGRLLTIVIMISGITLFVRFAQTLIRPYKVRFTCEACGLMRHDPDAVHCKACGGLLNIPNEE